MDRSGLGNYISSLGGFRMTGGGGGVSPSLLLCEQVVNSRKVFGSVKSKQGDGLGPSFQFLSKSELGCHLGEPFRLMQLGVP